MSKRALVLGGGGSVGIAWETGLAAGLADEGIDLRLADKIVGTSAGIVRRRGAGVGPCASRDAHAADRRRAGARRESDAERTAGARPHQADGIHDARAEERSGGAEAARRDRRVRAQAANSPEEACIGFFASVADTPWPAKYSCTAVDARDGRFVVLDQSTKTTRARRRVELLGARPLPADHHQWPPLRGRRHALRHELRSRRRLRARHRSGGDSAGAANFMAARIDPELAQLRRGGSHVELIAPDAASLEAFGPNLMDASRQLRGARSRRQTRPRRSRAHPLGVGIRRTRDEPTSEPRRGHRSAIRSDHHRRRRRRHLSAVPAAAARRERDRARSRGRPRRHVVSQPLSGLPVRFGELHVRLLVLEGALERMALEGTLLRSAREPALSQLRGRQVRSAQVHAVQLRRQPREVRRSEQPLAPALAERSRADLPLHRHRGRVCSPRRRRHAFPAWKPSKARRSTPITGRRNRWNSKANAWPLSAPAPPACR